MYEQDPDGDWQRHAEAVGLWAYTSDAALRWTQGLIERLEGGAHAMAGEGGAPPCLVTEPGRAGRAHARRARSACPRWPARPVHRAHRRQMRRDPRSTPRRSGSCCVRARPARRCATRWLAPGYPIAVADYQGLPEEARGVLPSAAELEAVIEDELDHRG